MKKTIVPNALEHNLTLLERRAQEGPVSIKEILMILSGRGRGLVIVFLSLPFCLPVQIPGISIPFGLLISFLGLRIAFGKHLWVPQSLLSKKISAAFMSKTSKKAAHFVRKINRWIHPRISWICRNKTIHIVHGLLIFLLGTLLALPLPIPLTNLAVAWPLLFIGLGLSEEDGLLVICSYCLSTLSFLFFLTLGLSLHYIKDSCY